MQVLWNDAKLLARPLLLYSQYRTKECDQNNHKKSKCYCQYLKTKWRFQFLISQHLKVCVCGSNTLNISPFKKNTPGQPEEIVVFDQKKVSRKVMIKTSGIRYLCFCYFPEWLTQMFFACFWSYFGLGRGKFYYQACSLFYSFHFNSKM